MNDGDLEHFERTNGLAHARAIDYLENEMPEDELVRWLIDVMPANDWGRFLKSFESLQDCPLEQAMKGWKINE